MSKASKFHLDTEITSTWTLYQLFMWTLLLPVCISKVSVSNSVANYSTWTLWQVVNSQLPEKWKFGHFGAMIPIWYTKRHSMLLIVLKRLQKRHVHQCGTSNYGNYAYRIMPSIFNSFCHFNNYVFITE